MLLLLFFFFFFSFAVAVPFRVFIVVSACVSMFSYVRLFFIRLQFYFDALASRNTLSVQSQTSITPHNSRGKIKTHTTHAQLLLIPLLPFARPFKPVSHQLYCCYFISFWFCSYDHPYMHVGHPKNKHDHNAKILATLQNKKKYDADNQETKREENWQ